MGEDGKNQGRPAGGGLRGNLVTLIVIAGILWAFLFFACRTTSGHKFVEGQIGNRLGMPVKAEKVALAPPLTLRLTNVQSDDYAEGQAGFHADEITVRVGYKPTVRVSLLRPELNLFYDGSTWFPTNFAALGDLPFRDLGSLSDACADWRDRMSVALEGGTLYWHGQPDGVIASARGVSFEVRPLAIPGHADAQFHSLRAASAVEPAGRQTDNVAVEWMSLGSRRYVELERSATLPAGVDAGFWGASDDKANGN